MTAIGEIAKTYSELAYTLRSREIQTRDLKLSEIGNKLFRTASSLLIDDMYPDIALAVLPLSGTSGDACSAANPSTWGIGALIKEISDYVVLDFLQ